MKMQKKYLIIAMASAMGVTASSTLIAADEVQEQSQLQFTQSFSLSNAQTPDLGKASKTKLVSLGNGMLISAFGEAVDETKMAYDVKGDVDVPAQDIFVRTCPSLTADCSVDANWSPPKNVSNTATKTSISTDWNGSLDENATRMPYYGDSDKPNISNGGANLMLTWTDKFCEALPGDADGLTDQRTVTYLTRDNREIPFSCTYAAYSFDSGKNWTAPQQLSDGSRDAKQDVSKVNSMGKAVITWQEDPMGLQLGSADGPGDGASGAIASHGTDIWYVTSTFEATKWEDEAKTIPIAGKPTGFGIVPTRLTDNATAKATGSTSPVKDAAGVTVDLTAIDGGSAAATRANTGMVGSDIVVAYEETKGSEELDIGKFIRYHKYAYGANPTNQVGCIISNPAENARRVRFVTNPSIDLATNPTGLAMGIFWKEGKYDQGGPSDIMVRVAKNGLAASNMSPAVDASCEAVDYATAMALNNSPAMNLSSNTVAGTNHLTDTTETNNIENALAHRGAIADDRLYVGYSYSEDWALSTYTNLVNYDFWMRNYDPVANTWSDAKNLSNLPSTLLTVREPRVVKASFSTDPAANYNPDAFIVAWGTQTNVASHVEEAQDLDIFYTRTFDNGATYEPVVRISNPDKNARFESQLRLTPDGQTVYSAWNETSTSGTDAMFAVGSNGPITGEDPYEGLYDVVSEEETGGVTTVYKTTSGGSAGVFDSVLLPLLVGIGIGFVGLLGLRKAKK